MQSSSTQPYASDVCRCGQRSSSKTTAPLLPRKSVKCSFANGTLTGRAYFEISSARNRLPEPAQKSSSQRFRPNVCKIQCVIGGHACSSRFHVGLLCFDFINSTASLRKKLRILLKTCASRNPEQKDCRAATDDLLSTAGSASGFVRLHSKA